MPASSSDEKTSPKRRPALLVRPLLTQQYLESGEEDSDLLGPNATGIRIISPFNREEGELMTLGCLSHGMTF